MRLYKNYKPLQLFGGLALLLFIISAGMFLPILIKFVHTGMVPNFPTLIVSGFIAMAAIMSLFSGMILSMIAEKNRQHFEFNLNLIDSYKKEKNGSKKNEEVD